MVLQVNDVVISIIHLLSTNSKNWQDIISWRINFGTLKELNLIHHEMSYKNCHNFQTECLEKNISLLIFVQFEVSGSLFEVICSVINRQTI